MALAGATAITMVMVTSLLIYRFGLGLPFALFVFIMMSGSPPTEADALEVFRDNRALIEDIVREVEAPPAIIPLSGGPSGGINRPGVAERRAKVWKMMRRADLELATRDMDGTVLTYRSKGFLDVGWSVDFVLVDEPRTYPPPIDVKAERDPDVLKAKLCLFAAPKRLKHLCDRERVVVSDLDVYMDLEDEPLDAIAWRHIEGRWYLRYAASHDRWYMLDDKEHCEPPLNGRGHQTSSRPAFRAVHTAAVLLGALSLRDASARW